MRKFAFALLAISLTTAGMAYSQCTTSIHTLQMNSPVGVNLLATPCNVVITAVQPSGFFGSQEPHGAWDAIWVYYPGHTFHPGDKVGICGVFREVCGLSTIDIPASGIYGWVLKPAGPEGTAPIPDANFVTAAELMASPEQWESVTTTITDGMTVPAGFSLGSGQWLVNALDGTSLRFDDFWYNFAQVMEGQCYNNATGILHDACGVYTYEPFAAGLPLVSCSVSEEKISLGAMKAKFR